MLAPDQSLVKEMLANFLDSYQSISLSAISLRNSQFFPVYPTPDWMQTLATNLSAAQTVANDFLVTQGPNVISQIPHFFVTYSNSVQVVASEMAKTTNLQDAIKQVIWLKAHIENIPATVAELSTSLNSVATNFLPYKDKISSALQQANADIKTDQADVATITAQISKLMADISAETVKSSNGMTGVITSGGSMSFALLSWSFAAATSLNPAAPIIGVALAIGGLTYGAITNAINEAKIVENLTQIKELSHNMLKDNQAIAALQALTPLLQSMTSSLDGVQKSIDLSPIWRQESQKVSSLLTTLQNYTGSDFKSLPEIASLPAAAATWETIAGWATNIEKFASGLTSLGTVELDQSSQLKLVR